MANIKIYNLIVIFVITLSGCVYNNHNWNNRLDYTICFNSREKVELFKNEMISFADQNKMKIFDRSAEAEQELRDLEHAKNMLDHTALPMIFISIQKKDWLNITMGNGSLEDDLGITFSFNSELPPTQVTAMMQAIKQKYRVVTLSKNGPGSFPCKNEFELRGQVQ